LWIGVVSFPKRWFLGHPEALYSAVFCLFANWHLDLKDTHFCRVSAIVDAKHGEIKQNLGPQFVFVAILVQDHLRSFADQSGKLVRIRPWIDFRNAVL